MQNETLKAECDGGAAGPNVDRFRARTGAPFRADVTALFAHWCQSFAPESVVRSRGRPPCHSRHNVAASSLRSPCVASSRP
jgi:hypothetical protein